MDQATSAASSSTRDGRGRFTPGCSGNPAGRQPGSINKATALRQFAERQGLALDEICFMGDDVNDLVAMDSAGMSAAPCNARPEAREKADVVTQASGGDGAVRELVDLILSGAARAR